MSTPHPDSASSSVPPLDELLVQYLRQQARAKELGLIPAATTGRVIPFEAAPVQAIDPRLAWTEALAVVRTFGASDEAKTWSPPPDWPVLVTGQEPALALAFALGNYPQLVRDWSQLLRVAPLSPLRPADTAPLEAPSLRDWAAQQAKGKFFARRLLVAGTFRLARMFDEAFRLLDVCEKEVPAAWRPAWWNERAALAWHRGQSEEAAALWQSQPVSVAVLFNRGMAALFADQADQAHAWLTQTVSQIPEDSGWHHLGRLYLALAESHR